MYKIKLKKKETSEILQCNKQIKNKNNIYCYFLIESIYLI